MRKEIEESRLSDRGKLQAYRVWETLKGMVHEQESSILPTGDRGLVLEFVCSGRDLLFAVPEDGGVICFIARGDDLKIGEFRHSGIIIENYQPLVDWSLWVSGKGMCPLTKPG